MEKSKKKKGGSLRDKLIKRREDLAKRGEGRGIIFPKTGTMRFRIRPSKGDEEFGIEIMQFYLGPKLGGVFSPATFDEDCPFLDKYRSLKESKDEDDLVIAKQLTPKRKYLICVDLYKDSKGKEIDAENKGKLMLIPSSVYQDIIDLWLDEEDWGDMTDLKKGYDLKLTRSGSGQFDTSYSIQPCQKSKAAKGTEPVDLEDMVRKSIPSTDDLESKLEDFLGTTSDSDDDDERSRKKKKKEKDTDKKKKKTDKVGKKKR